MRILNAKIFDDVISGTTRSWLTGAEFHGQIGQAEVFALQAVVSGVIGSPTLTVNSEWSCDSQNWMSPGVTYINEAIVEHGSYSGSYDIFTELPLAANVRFRIALSGTGIPACRLKLYVTGRLGLLA